jgi:hypothetical protein
VTDKLLLRIGALLAKAESTDSAPEAEALVAKAQELATLHAVDLAMARAHSARGHRRETPVQRKIPVGNRREQGRGHRVSLFVVVAAVNDTRVDVARDSSYVLAYGFPSDLEVVERLAASLATQMVGSANAAIRRGEHRTEVYWSEVAGAWRSDARVFRTAFNHGFVAAIAERLLAAREAALAGDAITGAGDGDGGPPGAGALVLARKGDEVDAYHRATSQARGYWRATTRSVAWSQAGHASGHVAGRSARLSAPRPLPGVRGQLP